MTSNGSNASREVGEVWGITTQYVLQELRDYRKFQANVKYLYIFAAKERKANISFTHNYAQSSLQKYL